MTKITIILYAWCIFTLQIYNVEAPKPNKPYQIEIIENTKQLTIPEIIKKFSNEYNLSSQMMSEIIFCESSFNTHAIHDGGQGKGVTGFHKNTFLAWEKQSGMNLNYDSTYDQIKLMSWAFAQGEKYRDDWTSYNRYKKYGTCKVSEIRKIEKRTL